MITIIVPMAGAGKKFIDKGYTFPKPLIEVHGRPLIEIVAENLRPKEPHRFVFICQREHLEKYALSDVLELIAPESAVVAIPADTGGALCTVLLAVEAIPRQGEILIANSDQYVEASVDAFLSRCRLDDADGCIMTFPSTHPKWSYAKVDEAGHVVTVAEKRPISKNATVGLYYFKTGEMFIQAAERHILKGARTSGEFYVCPVYNELILDGRKITTFPIAKKEMFSLGTPEDLEAFVKSKALEVEST